MAISTLHITSSIYESVRKSEWFVSWLLEVILLVIIYDCAILTADNRVELSKKIVVNILGVYSLCHTK